ncbi:MULTISPECIES: hypothetical protein [Hungatella]|uniref:hypothetical protein n=1 Tax=Hungatella TaxID=1649459 RepID=UPI0011DDF667|nr:hypothetical protein [Hungatella hathewayi]MCQ5384528.1 hypothetical protein [Hungatella hathewayi]
MTTKEGIGGKLIAPLNGCAKGYPLWHTILRSKVLKTMWQTKPLPVLSSRTDEKDKIQALLSGANGYIQKPYKVGRMSGPGPVTDAAIRRAKKYGEPMLYAGIWHGSDY